eukprot:1750342-Pleurochrysis_carterae.AAC.2
MCTMHLHRHAASLPVDVLCANAPSARFYVRQKNAGRSSMLFHIEGNGKDNPFAAQCTSSTAVSYASVLAERAEKQCSWRDLRRALRGLPSYIHHFQAKHSAMGIS